jgi:hypothetical protein
MQVPHDGIVYERRWYAGAHLTAEGDVGRRVAAWIDWTAVCSFDAESARTKAGATVNANANANATLAPWLLHIESTPAPVSAPVSVSVSAPAPAPAPATVSAPVRVPDGDCKNTSASTALADLDTYARPRVWAHARYKAQPVPVFAPQPGLWAHQVRPEWIGAAEGTDETSGWKLWNALDTPNREVHGPWNLHEPWSLIDCTMRLHVQSVSDLLEHVQSLAIYSPLTTLRIGPKGATWSASTGPPPAPAHAPAPAPAPAPIADQKRLEDCPREHGDAEEIAFVPTELGRAKKTLWFDGAKDARTREARVHIFPFRAFADAFSGLTGTCSIGIVPDRRPDADPVAGRAVAFRFFTGRDQLLFEWLVPALAPDAVPRVRML